MFIVYNNFYSFYVISSIAMYYAILNMSFRTMIRIRPGIPRKPTMNEVNTLRAI